MTFQMTFSDSGFKLGPDSREKSTPGKLGRSDRSYSAKFKSYSVNLKAN